MACVVLIGDTMDLRSVFRSVLMSSLAGCGGVVVAGDGGDLDAQSKSDSVVPDAAGVCRSTKPSMQQPCGWEVSLSGDCSALTSGGLSPTKCAELCGFGQTACMPGWNGPGSLYCGQACEGRRPPGLGDRQHRGPNAVGEWFARAAFLEAASVDAFHILHDELAHHGAPPELLAEALSSAREEVSHARMMRALAKSFGAAWEPPSVQRARVRDLEAIALENAVEGCVRETYGALQNAWQAERAASSSVRAAMRVIARDEAKHASLAWKIAAWADARLDPDARARVARARRDAVAELERSIALVPDTSVVRTCGIPHAASARSLVEGLKRELWN